MKSCSNYGNISFNAIYRGKYKVNNNNKQEPAYFVEIDPYNREDARAFEKLDKYWRNALYTSGVYDTVAEKYAKNINYKNYKVYALTSQDSNFQYLDDDKILGFAEVIEGVNNNSKIYLNHIEGNPEHIYKTKREISGIGTAMLNGLKDIYNRIDLIARKSKTVKNFYMKNDFTELPPDSGYFIWIKDIFKNFMI